MTNGSDTVVITWTTPVYSVTIMDDVTRCYPIGIPNHYTCESGDAFPITYSFTGEGRRIRVEYEVYISYSPSVVSEICEFYLRVLGKLIFFIISSDCFNELDIL